MLAARWLGSRRTLSLILLPYLGSQHRRGRFFGRTEQCNLGTLPGGTDALALLVNERGQIVGQSYAASRPRYKSDPLIGDALSFTGLQLSPRSSFRVKQLPTQA